MYKDYIENYKLFKKTLNNNDSYFENNSIGENELFGLKDFYSSKYLNNDYEIDISTIKIIVQELEEVLLKSKYVLGCFKDIELKLLEQNKKLDAEFFDLNQISTKGQSFLRMFKLPEHYNHILDTKIIYQKNIISVNDKFIKTKNSLNSISFYLDYHSSSSFFIVFDKEYYIRDIFIDLYKERTFSIFGVKKDGTMELIKDNIKSKTSFITNTNENKYNKIFVSGISDINNLLKEVKVFSYIEDDVANKNGYVTYFLDDLNKFSEYIFVSDDETKIYLFNETTYNDVINLLATNENLCISKYFNKEFEVQKNIKIENSFENKMYLLEFFNKKQVQSNELKIFAKEK